MVLLGRWLRVNDDLGENYDLTCRDGYVVERHMVL